MDKVELTKFEREYSYLRYGGSATEFMLDNPEAVKQIKEEAKIVLELAEKEVKRQNQKYNIPQELIDAYQEFMKFGGDNTRAVINAINALNSTEELISKDLEKAAQKAYPEDIHKQSIFIHGATYAYTHSKNTQLLDEGLEEAATKYAQDKYMAVQTFQAFKAGANWQKKQDQKSMEIMDEVYFKSCDMIRKQMIDKACAWIKEIDNHHDIMRYSDCCEVLFNELIESFKNYMNK